MRLLNLSALALLATATLATAVPAAAQEAQPAQATRAVAVQPYIEVSQIVLAELSPGDDVLTYTQLAAGIDATVTGRNNGGSISLRYERNISWNGDDVDSDTISGIARGYASIVPQTVTFEVGALASRTQVDGGGGSSFIPLVSEDSESRIYSVYAGPNVHTRVGDVHVNALGRVGYTRFEAPDALPVIGSEPLDVFDESVTYRGEVHLAIKPGEPLPVGLGVGGGYFQEDVSNLDQRVRDAHVRADVTVPVTPTLAVVAGIGYEDVEISSRDAVRDVNGFPIIGSNGRFVTDKSQPRQIAYEVDGLIWDVGVLWRPSRRTSLEAHVGKRYDSTTYYGSFAWRPNSYSQLNISAYDGVSGFGGVLTSSLAALPTEFEAVRNSLTGDFNGCVTGQEQSGCVGGIFGSVRSAVFRGRGVQASYSRQLGRYTASVGAGYDRRKFIAASGTVLAAANGVSDESYYIASSLSGQLGPNAGFTVGSYINWFESGFANGGDLVGMGSYASYNRSITPKLTARAAIAFDYLDSDLSAEDLAAASALLGLRYAF
ncbi:preprotein translocase subunit YajC [Altererythrobacter arenosus]|uniref:Preprotein translocase subunit YajC n=1 Tax=Altererythrobacter arenosus TaxID=3032592 RepID=A0ABY8FQ96_9SPHN|nr:preprotein translocase subunit YajC [Altererythrobacter sp. CAU 1644]WFL77188.1 preprotein translocase subunit YajC [Altererythrobacter sp. CAU 1644]